jgi:hypothetical protein
VYRYIDVYIYLYYFFIKLGLFQMFAQSIQ